MKYFTSGICPACRLQVAAGLASLMFCNHTILGHDEPHTPEQHIQDALHEPVVRAVTTYTQLHATVSISSSVTATLR